VSVCVSVCESVCVTLCEWCQESVRGLQADLLGESW
jgi:hypothetical protein